MCWWCWTWTDRDVASIVSPGGRSLGAEEPGCARPQVVLQDEQQVSAHRRMLLDRGPLVLRGRSGCAQQYLQMQRPQEADRVCAKARRGRQPLALGWFPAV